MDESFELPEDIEEKNEKAKLIAEQFERVRKEVAKLIVGQDSIIERLLIALLSDGHVLLEGLPGLGKTMMISTLARVIGCNFKRVQFTPDLLPADIIGTKVYNQKTLSFETKIGPIFTNILLADEINRAPPKTQAALLEGMQERQVTISGDTLRLPEPFFVLATQNPIELEGTYPLPEAQVDRFLLKVMVSYPSREEEIAIMDRIAANYNPELEKILESKEIVCFQRFVKDVYMDEKIKKYIADIIFASRRPEEFELKDLKPLVEYGASPRASISLALASKAKAVLEGRGYVIPDDVKALAFDVLRHRLILSYEAEAEEIKVDDVISRIIEAIEPP